MIDRNLIIRQADADQVDARVVERDYVLVHVLESLAQHEASGSLIFKGGTALRMCFIPEYRYSADLDFSLLDQDKSSAYSVLGEVLANARERIGFPTMELDESDPPRIRFTGPLGSKERDVKLDLADDELVEETASRPILRRYPDQGDDLACLAYTLEEIGSEKLRCIMQRVQCRDLLDLHELFENQGVRADEVWLGFERKARHRGLDPVAFPAALVDRIGRYTSRWDSELGNYVVGDIPALSSIERSVRRHLRPILRS